MDIKNKFFHTSIIILYVIFIIYTFNDSIKVIYHNGLDHNYFTSLFYVGVLFYLIIEKIKLININLLKSNIFWGTFFFILSTALTILSNLGSVLVFKDLAFMLFLISILIFIGGFYLFYHFSLILLFILIPTGIFESFVTSFSIYLQLTTTYLTSCFLNMLGIFHITNGIYLSLTNITLIVEQSCNGANQITLLLIFTIILLNRLQSSLPIKLLIIFMTFIIGLVLNSLRITTISLWSFIFQEKYLHGPANIFYTSTIFVLGIFIIFYIINNINPHRDFYDRRKQMNDMIYIERNYVTIYIITLMVLSIILLNILKPYPIYIDINNFILPKKIIQYQLLDNGIYNKNYIIPGAYNSINQLYYNDTGDSINVYVAYLAMQTQDAEIVNYLNQNLYKRSHPLYLTSGEIVNMLWYEDNKHSGYLYFWYMIDGEVYNNPIRAKQATFQTGLPKLKNNGAFVVIWSLNNSDLENNIKKADGQFITELIPEIKKILSNTYTI